MSGGDDRHKLSTSALAKALSLPLQQLFATLRDCGWIRKLEDGWALTAKGEFEGGEYVHSRRYGRYIVWPDSLLEHPLLRGLESNRVLTAVQIGRRFGLHAREVRRLLGELGLLVRGFNGWELTRRGEQLGGIAVGGNPLEHDGADGDICWPESLLEDAVVLAQLEYLQRLYSQATDTEGDLLRDIGQFDGLDGHRFHTRGEWLICHWLYLAGINHACHRRLPLAEEHRADFWLPEPQIYLEYSGEEHDGAALSARLHRLEIYRQQRWSFVEVRAEHLAQLDDYLTRQLRKLGARVF